MNKAAKSAELGSRRQPCDHVSQELITTDVEIPEGGKRKRNHVANCMLIEFVYE